MCVFVLKTKPGERYLPPGFVLSTNTHIRRFGRERRYLVCTFGGGAGVLSEIDDTVKVK
jgi:hypothetical protein